MMFVILLLCGLAVTQGQNLQVVTTEGLIEGSQASDGNYHVFYGIPYAAPATGENRFRAPMPPPPYPGLFHAMYSNVICAQPSSRGLIGIENCLTLSIFTSNVTTPKPVMVWLNAEEYTTSSTTPYSFKNFIEEGIVVVSMNFRLSVFGFLCLGVPEAPGNAGIKDVIQGLNWIKMNIAGFGGNPDNVSLFGHGSAAAIVDFITMSPQAENLVHKAIAISGSALAPWAVAYDPIGYANLLGQKLGYAAHPPSDLARLLIITDIYVLGPALNDFKFTNNTPLFAPCIEDRKANGTVLTDTPINILRSGNYINIPYIGGYVNREGTMRAEEAAFENWMVRMQTNFTEFLQVDLDFGDNETEAEHIKYIKDFYFSKNPLNMDIEDYLDYQGDTLVLVSVIRGVKERANTSQSEVRLLEFAYFGTFNSDWTYNQVPLNGVKHGGILNYLFNYDLRPVDRTVMTSVVKRLAAFVHFGSPAISGNQTIEWPAIVTDRLNYLHYGGSWTEQQNTPTNVEQPKFDPYTTRMAVWNKIYSDYYKAPSPVSSAGAVKGLLYVVLFSIVFVRLLV